MNNRSIQRLDGGTQEKGQGDMADQTSLEITRPLVFVDLETTGVNPAIDRIIDITVLKIRPDGTKEEKIVRVNPGIPISPGATKVHGITN